ncbi:MAG: helix-turn-helix domain-containing protein [Parcubacteria group bacterium]
MEDWKAIVGANVRRLRLAQGLTQEQLAFEAQIDLTYLGGIERGRRNPSLLVIVRIAEVLGTAPAAILRVGEGDPRHAS